MKKIGRLVPAKNHEGEFVPSSHGMKKPRGRFAGQFTEYSDFKRADLEIALERTILYSY